MAVNQLRYYQQYNKLRDRGLSHEEAHRRATKFATIKAKKKKESTIRRLARLMKMAALGKHYKVPRKARRSETVRAKTVTKGLRGAGLTEEEIARFKR